MAKIPYIRDNQAGPAELVAAIKARRGGELLNLDRMLLHSPALASAWNQYLGAIRSELSVPTHLRELAMCAVAIVNRAEYEFMQHAPLYIKAGASQAQVNALRDLDSAVNDASLFNTKEQAVIALSVAMTRDVDVDDSTFERVQQSLSEPRELVEIVAVIATYNMVSRFLVALGVEPED